MKIEASVFLTSSHRLDTVNLENPAGGEVRLSYVPKADFQALYEHRQQECATVA